MPRPEDKLKDKMVKHIESKFGQRVVVFKINDACSKGIPDLLICLDGRFIAIEVKVPGAPIAKRQHLQQYFIEKVYNAGGLGAICKSIDDIDIVLNMTKGGK